MVDVLPETRAEAVESAVWYDQKCAGLGLDFLQEAASAFDRVRISPDNLPAFEAYPGPQGIRRCRLKRFPFA